MSAHLHWLSMEREQEDREGSRRMMDVMDDGAESRFRALTAACSRQRECLRLQRLARGFRRNEDLGRNVFIVSAETVT